MKWSIGFFMIHKCWMLVWVCHCNQNISLSGGFVLETDKKKQQHQIQSIETQKKQIHRDTKSFFLSLESITYWKKSRYSFQINVLCVVVFFSVEKYLLKRTAIRDQWSIWRSHSVRFRTCIKYLCETFELTTQLWTKRSIETSNKYEKKKKMSFGIFQTLVTSTL